MFSPYLTVREVSESCGFASLSSFSRAFKSYYKTTPGEWRSGTQYDGTHFFLSDPEINSAYRRLENTALPEPKIVRLEPRQVAYIRHKGYGRSIKKPWKTIMSWATSENRSSDIQIGLHHSNPALVPLENCRYVVCLGIDKPIARRGLINSAEIPGGLHAAFDLSGRYGELLPYISKMLEEWLPVSGFIAKTTPAFAIYKKNQYLDQDDLFDLVFYQPITPLWVPRK
jgi:AraC family transcriptional regulator